MIDFRQYMLDHLDVNKDGKVTLSDAAAAAQAHFSDKVVQVAGFSACVSFVLGFVAGKLL